MGRGKVDQFYCKVAGSCPGLWADYRFQKVCGEGEGELLPPRDRKIPERWSVRWQVQWPSSRCSDNPPPRKSDRSVRLHPVHQSNESTLHLMKTGESGHSPSGDIPSLEEKASHTHTRASMCTRMHAHTSISLSQGFGFTGQPCNHQGCGCLPVGRHPDPPALPLGSPLPPVTIPLGVPLRPGGGGSALAHRMIQHWAVIRSVILRVRMASPRHRQHLGA